MNKAVFLDRDGVINIDGHYVHRAEDFVFMDGIFEFCRAAQKSDYILLVVTNQSGIARGYYTETEFMALSDWMCDKFEEQQVHITKVYYCPFHLKEGIGRYKVESDDRKPQPGMLLRGMAEYGIDMQQSIAIGDKDSDMEAGRKAGVGKLLLLCGDHETADSEDVTRVDSLLEAIKYLKMVN